MPLSSDVRTDRYVPDASVEECKTSAHAAVMHILQMQDVMPAHHRELLSIALWKWTEAAGLSPNPKYNIRFCSERVRSGEPTAVNHEHVWTRQGLVTNLLRNHRMSDAATVRSLLDEYGVACIVTVAEHSRLGRASRTGPDGWERYVRAGVEVWDRQHQCRWTFDNRNEPALGEVKSVTTVAPLITTDEAIALRGRDRGDLLRRLFRTLTFADCAAVVGMERDRTTIGNYVLIHDVQIEEPTPVLAYVHWSGKVTVRAVLDDVPAELAALDCIERKDDKGYDVHCHVNDLASMEAAEELVMVAVQKYRKAYADGVVQGRSVVRRRRRAETAGRRGSPGVRARVRVSKTSRSSAPAGVSA